jgi:myo-inositol 2-dehydrogenase / D-chiro-inositol 1-dehydrogenase
MIENKKISRKHFLGTSFTLGLAGFGLGSILSSCGRAKRSHEELGLPSMKNIASDGKKIKAGLIGTGNRGTGAALNFLSAGNDLELVALADVFKDQVDICRSQLKKYDFEVADENCFYGFDAYKKVLDSDVDVVLLATPPHFRPEHFKAAIEAKKHVFMEKPLAVDPVGIRTIRSAGSRAESLGLCVVTGTQRRHREDYIETFKQVANGAIGKLVSAKAYWNQSHVWYRKREQGWSDMEYMIRNWNNFCWLCGDHILDTHVHNIDIINWFMEKYPKSANGYGGRHRRITGDQYDFFSIDFDYGNGVYSHSMSRQIDDCANGVGEFIMGTNGYTNCKNKIFNMDGEVIWEYEYPDPKKETLKISPYIQEHIHLVDAIRTGNYINQTEETALSTLTAIMGREAAYSGKIINWKDMLNSDLRLGPNTYALTNINMEFNAPVPGKPHDKA